MRRNYVDSEFYCVKCGNKVFDIWRRKGAERNAGHLKRLYCLKCKEEINCCEIKFGCINYTYEDFLLEFEGKNFNDNGERILPFGEFKQKLIKEKKYDELIEKITKEE